jgi:hypothetical protein
MKCLPTNGLLHLKLTMDESKGIVSIGMIPLNVKIFPTQGIRSIFYLAKYIGTESLGDLNKYASQISRDIKKTVQEGFLESGERYKVIITWTSDLKSFWNAFNISSDEFCPFCRILKSQICTFRTFPKRKLNGFFAVDNVTMCSLHCRCRITEKLLKLLTFNREDLVDQLAQAVRSVCGIQVNFTYKEVNESDDICYLKCSMINGSDADKIIMNGEKIITKMKEYCDTKIEYENINWKSIAIIWKIWKLICFVMNLDSVQVRQISLSTLNLILFIWKYLIISTFGSTGMTYYIHIVVDHLPDLLSIDCLSKYSQESFENGHKDGRMQFDRGSTKNGAWHHISKLMQIMQRMYRILLIKLYKKR